ncbi:MAG: SDR family oxidoreductase [Gemmatimonadaceae bacterium]
MEILITGGTGYMGARLIPKLVERGHHVRALARAGSENKVPRSATAVTGDALVTESIVNALRPGDTLVHLVGTPHPSPRKAVEFARVDLPSIRASVEAGKKMGIAHLVYVSVAQPAPVMHAYVAVRAQGEALIRESGIPATILRPWYVVGPGHRWALALTPLYGIAKLFPPTRDGATRLGLVTIDQMVAALIAAVESPPAEGVRIVEVPDIRRSRLTTVERLRD